MPQEEIDLDKIIELEFSEDMIQFIDSMSFTREYVKDAMREACRQILLVASEKAKVKKVLGTEGNVIDHFIVVDKESITSCITLIKP